MVGFIERHKGGERAVLVHITLPRSYKVGPLPEFQELVHAAGVLSQALLTGSRDVPAVSAFIGRGKLDELVELVCAHEAEVVIFNHHLTPAQARTLEKRCQCKVVDRTELILDIFAQRAQTFEGRLQVELAQLKHLSTRLVRGWTHLERQKGGIGLRGPGETQLETDRRLLAVRIKYISARLHKVQMQREQGRRRRHRRAAPTVVMVGYTNAGKSTLFNALTKAEVYADAQLFATLDPTYRQLDLAGTAGVVLVDTVGFIRNLPHDLIEAFKATLEEATLAQLLCHVIDASHLEQDEIKAQVQAVLEQIGADRVPQLLVYNKIDLLPQFTPQIIYNEEQVPIAVEISAQDEAGLDLLRAAIAQRIAHSWVRRTITLAYSQADVRAWFYEHQAVASEQEDNKKQQWKLGISLSKRQFEQAEKAAGYTFDK